MGIQIRNFLLTAVLSTGLVYFPVQALASEPAGGTDRFISEFADYMSETVLPYVPGAAVVVIAEGKVKLIQTYGVRKTGTSEPVTQDTIFRLASVSKTFASAATELLVRDNLLSWDTTINSRLKDVKFKDMNYGKRITIRNILSQTSGLMPHAYTNLIEDNVPYNAILSRLKEVDFICAPGDCYSYQNVVFSLSGDVIQSVSGESYEEFVNENLFIPLDMRTASIGYQSFKSTKDRATPHVRRAYKWQPVNVKSNFYNVAPAAGVNASISDMKQWLFAQLGHRPDILPDEALDELHARTVRTSAYQAHYKRRKELGNVYYGLGWRIFDFGDYKNFIHHGGWVEGTVSEMIFNRDLQLGMVFLTNAESPDVGELVFRFLELFEDHQRPSLQRVKYSSVSGG